MDVVDSATRSRMMARIRSKDTKPEMTVRRYLHARGFRYRLHAADLPGKPDLVLKGYPVAILVHGCFWHRHAGCSFATTPKSNAEWWNQKFQAGIERDSRKMAALQAAGWYVIVVWECELKRNPEERLCRLALEIKQQSREPSSISQVEFAGGPS